MTALAEVVLKGDGVASIAFVGSVGEVAEEGDEANQEVEDDVEKHFCADGGGEGCFGSGADHHEREEEVEDVTDGRNQTNNTRPTEAEPTHAEEGHVEHVCPPFDLDEDLLFGLGEARGKGLAELLFVGSEFDVCMLHLSGGGPLEEAILLAKFVFGGFLEDLFDDEFAY